MIRSLTEQADELVRRLALTSASQALVRLLAALSAIGALLLVAPWPLERTAPSVMIGVLVGALVLWQSIRPDSDAGLAILAVVVLVVALGGTGALASTYPTGAGAGAALRILAAALAVHLAHTGWALAAVGPAPAVIEPPALRAAARRAGVALAAAVLVGALVVLPLLALPVAGWAVVPAGVALVALTVLLIPRERG